MFQSDLYLSLHLAIAWLLDFFIVLSLFDLIIYLWLLIRTSTMDFLYFINNIKPREKRSKM